MDQQPYTFFFNYFPVHFIPNNTSSQEKNYIYIYSSQNDGTTSTESGQKPPSSSSISHNPRTAGFFHPHSISIRDNNRNERAMAGSSPRRTASRRHSRPRRWKKPTDLVPLPPETKLRLCANGCTRYVIVTCRTIIVSFRNCSRGAASSRFDAVGKLRKEGIRPYFFR